MIDSASANFTFQPSSRCASVESAYRAGGSPARRGASTTGTFLAGDLFHRADDLAVGTGAAGAEVVEERGAGRGEPVEDGDVRAAQVVHVHVVAQAGAVRGGVVGAEKLQVRAPAQRGVDRERDEVRLGIVVLADGAVLGGAGGVEIAEGGETQAVRPGAGPAARSPRRAWSGRRD